MLLNLLLKWVAALIQRRQEGKSCGLGIEQYFECETSEFLV